MPALSEHWSEGNYLPEGEHLAKVTAVKPVEYHSGNKGVEFTVRNEHGQERGVSFVLVDKALWKLATFVAACGFTKEQCRDYGTDSMASHRRLIGRKLYVTVEPKPGKDGKTYNEIVSWRKAEIDTLGGTPANGGTRAPWSGEPERAPKAAAATAQDDVEAQDDIPF